MITDYTYKRRLWGVALLVCLFFLFALNGCAIEPLTESEQYALDDKRVREADVWRICLNWYKSRGIWTLHKNHKHNQRTGEVLGSPMVKHRAIQDDIMSNRCNQIVRQLERGGSMPKDF